MLYGTSTFYSHVGAFSRLRGYSKWRNDNNFIVSISCVRSSVFKDFVSAYLRVHPIRLKIANLRSQVEHATCAQSSVIKGVVSTLLRVLINRIHL